MTNTNKIEWLTDFDRTVLDNLNDEEPISNAELYNRLREVETSYPEIAALQAEPPNAVSGFLVQSKILIRLFDHYKLNNRVSTTEMAPNKQLITGLYHALLEYRIDDFTSTSGAYERLVLILYATAIEQSIVTEALDKWGASYVATTIPEILVLMNSSKREPERAHAELEDLIGLVLAIEYRHGGL